MSAELHQGIVLFLALVAALAFVVGIDHVIGTWHDDRDAR